MTSSSGPKFAIGDLVWAKMKGFSPWPGRIVDGSQTNLRSPKPPGNLRQKSIQCVYFFGSNNFGWIQEDAIKPYTEYKEQNCKLNKSHAFKEAIEKIEEFMKTGDPALAGIVNSDEEIATIFTGNKSDGEEKKTTTNATTTPTTTQQRDYSRTPFGKSKAGKKVSSTPANDEDVPPPPAKRAKSSSIEENTNSLPAKSPAKTAARNILNRQSQYLLDSNSTTINDQTEVDMKNVSAKSKTIQASSLKFGFIGLGLMGQRLLKNLLNSGHQVTIWNRTPSKCKDFLKAGAVKATTPADVVAASDIVFSCLADPHAVKEIVFGNCGILAEIRSPKGYVEMTTIDADTSNDISEAILARGGRFLEAPLIGSGKLQAEEGNLTVIASGDKSLFDECNSSFQAISKHAFYLGSQVGDASKMNLIVSMLIGNLIGSLAESMALADRTNLSQKDLLEILSISPLNCATLISKGKSMIDGGFATEMPLTHMQKDLRLALQLAEVYEHPIPITASTNEVFKHAKHLGYSEHDVAAVYIRSRF
ncbi:cytokine-like nuclear factor N-PAC isoform X2 [Oppia nitens]|uniref:cytokine-like nuclear factor N-PAC isoform X2 n=1 Tax=Oppia nitens TaxID=1686743 RepID=UPI0023DC49F7|nr:cytokine-like nuclear factor N-PAC isoform X2 [Oppia nitens]